MRFTVSAMARPILFTFLPNVSQTRTNVSSSYQRNKTKSIFRRLKAFINEDTRSIKTGRHPFEAGQAWMGRAELIIARKGGQKNGKRFAQS